MQTGTTQTTDNGLFDEMTGYAEWALETLLEFVPQLIAAIVILIVGWIAVNFIIRMLERFFRSRDYDVSLEKFIVSLSRWILRALLIITVIAQLGVQTSSFIAMLGALGLAIGLALQGSLSNFAGGVLILIFRPFKIGDYIAAQGHDGTVDLITIINTQLLTVHNQRVTIPNGALFNGTIKNYSAETTRREFLDFGIAYDDNIELGKKILMDLVREKETILDLPEPQVVVSALGDSSVNISVRYWAKNEDFWATRFYMLEEGKRRLESAGITIPFPQRDVHIIKDSE
jgi:small conductance mechanosensitive channel